MKHKDSAALGHLHARNPIWNVWLRKTAFNYWKEECEIWLAGKKQNKKTKVTLTTPHLKSPHYILLLQLPKAKIINVDSSFLSHWNEIGHGGEWRQTHTKTWTFEQLRTCTLKNEHLCSHSHFATHAHAHTHHSLPPPIGSQMSELFRFSTVTRKKQNREKRGGGKGIWSRWHHHTILLVYLFPKSWKK